MNLADNNSDLPASTSFPPMKGSVWFFFLLTFAISWTIYLPGVLDALGVLDLQLSPGLYTILNVLGGFGPSIAGILLLYYNEGREGIKDLYHRAIRGMGMYWWVAVFLLVPTIHASAVLLSFLTTGNFPEMVLLAQPLLIAVYFIGGMLPISNAFREEFGWRGYALDRLQSRWGSALVGSVILGVVWGLWHLPLFVFPTAQEVYSRTNILIYILNTIAITIYMTWIYNNTNRSLLSALVLHTVINVSGSVFPFSNTEYGVYYNVILQMIVAATIVIVFGQEKMSRVKEEAEEK